MITRRNLLKTGGLIAASGAGLGLLGGYRAVRAAAPVELKARETAAVLDGTALTEGVMT